MFGFYVSIPFTKYEIINLNNNLIIEDNSNIDTSKYVSSLIKEIMLYQNYYKSNQSIYVGGVDPLSISYDDLEKLLIELSHINNFEYTFEIDPANFDINKINLLRKYNVNRISLKVITFSDELLKILKKPYKYNDILKIIKTLRKKGFNNINIDLNFNIPNQTISHIKFDLLQLKNLNINHVSYYEIDIMKDSILYKQYKNNNTTNIIDYYEYIVKTLKNYKYEHYEISHFTNNKKYSLQNIIYWTLEEYIGAGLNAHSFINNHIKINNSILNEYLKKPTKEYIKQSKEDNIKNYLFYGLSQFRGINIKEFKEKYKFDILDNYPKLKYYIENELLSLNNDILKLTNKGSLYSSLILEVFLWDLYLKTMNIF